MLNKDIFSHEIDLFNERTSSRLSQDSDAFWSAGISGSRSWICRSDSGSSSSSSRSWQLLDRLMEGRVSGAAAGTGGGGLECRSKKSCAAADALSLTGFTISSRASASSDRTRLHSCSISLMLALSCCRTVHDSQVTQSEIPLWCLEN